jgi:hypothetical protein
MYKNITKLKMIIKKSLKIRIKMTRRTMNLMKANMKAIMIQPMKPCLRNYSKGSSTKVKWITLKMTFNTWKCIKPLIYRRNMVIYSNLI